MPSKELRLLFAGNPEIGIESLRTLNDNFNVVGVLTNPDRPVGRSKKAEAPPIKQEAEKLGLSVIQFERLLSESRAVTRSLGANFLVSFACGHYFGSKFLGLFEKGAINVHPSLLPRHRGCAPLQFAILNGETKSGITIQRIAGEIDSGNILNQMNFEIDGKDTYLSLQQRVGSLSAPFLVETLKQIIKGEIEEIVQDHQKATYTRLLTKEDGLIDWNKSAKSIHCQIRALYPWPKAYTLFKDKTLIISGVSDCLEKVGKESAPPCVIPGTVLGHVKNRGLAIACGDGILYVNKLQLAQKKELDSASFVNGNSEIIDSLLGC
ncbi:MAG: methionyl-tRNA formyltransferase [Sphaerochaetaceae bacterium]